MKNLLPRVLWDYVIGVIVGVVMTVLSLAVIGLILQAVLQTGEARELLQESLAIVGFVTLLGVILVVSIYELVLLFRARGKMMEPGETESRLLTREAILRALLSGAVAGLYAALVITVFTLLAHEASDLNLIVVFALGLLPAIMILAAGALAYAFIGADVGEQQGELDNWERGTLLLLPLALAVLFGLFFGAAAGDAQGIISAVVAALLTYGLVRELGRLRWRVLQRSLERILRARGGPTIKVVSTHRG